jgi:hypothetical protein
MGGKLESISNSEGMDTFVEEKLGLLKEGASEHNYTCGTISNFIVLTLGELDE